MMKKKWMTKRGLICIEDIETSGNSSRRGKNRSIRVIPGSPGPDALQYPLTAAN